MFGYYAIYYAQWSATEWKKDKVSVPVANLDNAKEWAKEISRCVDVSGSVAVVNCMTGEVMAEYEEGNCSYEA